MSTYGLKVLNANGHIQIDSDTTFRNIYPSASGAIGSGLDAQISVQQDEELFINCSVSSGKSRVVYVSNAGSGTARLFQFFGEAETYNPYDITYGVSVNNLIPVDYIIAKKISSAYVPTSNDDYGIQVYNALLTNGNPTLAFDSRFYLSASNTFQIVAIADPGTVNGDARLETNVPLVSDPSLFVRVSALPSWPINLLQTSYFIGYQFCNNASGISGIRYVSYRGDPVPIDDQGTHRFTDDSTIIKQYTGSVFVERI